MPDVRDMMSPGVVVAMESQQQQQHQQHLPHGGHPAVASTLISAAGHYAVPMTNNSQATTSTSSSMHFMPSSMASMMANMTKSEFDEFAMLEQSLLVQQQQQQHQNMAEEIMAEGRQFNGQLTAAMTNAALNAANMFHHPSSGSMAHQSPHHVQHHHPQQQQSNLHGHNSPHVPPHHVQPHQHQQQMWQRAMHAMPDTHGCGGQQQQQQQQQQQAFVADEHSTPQVVDEFYGQRLWATFEDIFDTEAMAGIEESLQTASIQAHIPASLASGITAAASSSAAPSSSSVSASSCKNSSGVVASTTNQIWDEFFSAE